MEYTLHIDRRARAYNEWANEQTLQAFRGLGKNSMNIDSAHFYGELKMFPSTSTYVSPYVAPHGL